MTLQSSTRTLLFALSLTLLTGCDPFAQPEATKEPAPESLDGLQAHARQNLDAAKQAESKGEAEAAHKAAQLALEAIDKALEKAKEAEAASKAATPDKDAKQTELVALKSRAQFLLHLTEEQTRLEGLLHGWKTTGYRKARGFAMTGAFKGLALASRQVDEEKLAESNKALRASVELGANLVRVFGAAKPVNAEGQTDWPKVAEVLDGFAEKPPEHLTYALVSGFGIMTKFKWALIELDMIDSSQFSEDDKRRYTIARSVLLSFNDFPELATRELSSVDENSVKDQTHDRNFLASAHALLMLYRIMKLDFGGAEKELVRIMRLVPNSPLVVFLTGERIAASGEPEKAAKSIETLQALQGHEWFGKMLADRAKALRDKGGEAEPLFTDKKFLVSLAVGFLKNESKGSETLTNIYTKVQSGKELCQRVLEKLPGSE